MNKKITYTILILVLAVCVWVGWSNFEFRKPEITQEEIRDGIRFYIRTFIQLLIQYVIPVAIVGFFVKEGLGKTKK